MLLDSALQRAPYSHFVSVPLRDPAFAAKFTQFRDTLGKDFSSCEGIDPSLVIEPRRMHLTLVMLKLPTGDLVKRAAGVLRAATSDFVRGRREELRLRLMGLEYMNDDPSQVNILYGKVDEQDGGADLQRFACDLIQGLVTAGILPEEELMKQRIRQPDGSLRVKLHATLLNSKFASDKGQGGGRPHFDARQILEAHGDSLELGKGCVSEVHLSVLGPVDRSTGYYVPSEKLQLR